MLFPDRRKQYPNLLQFLRESSRRKTDFREPIPMGGIMAMVACAVVAGALIPVSIYAAFLPIAIGLGLLGFYMSRGKDPDTLEPRQRLALESSSTLKVMTVLADQNRLHRELDEATLQMLEECAHHWRRVQVVFNSPFWTSESLPPAYIETRTSALRGAEMTMDELILIHRAAVPSQVAPRQASDYIQEAIETFVSKKPPVPDYIPTSFDATIRIAEKLQTLADEAEKVSRSLVIDPSGGGVQSPGTALDASLSELRQIRQAEEELRQNLHGGA